ncbi:Peroxisome assembly factor 2 containing the AAA-type ATPase domain [Phaffia rhodozyma]|uniref:Peroxisomal ATPase PEX6 n=1 Tax=Phaffia rhodozyma TaxID=264483 RepID=A0A0F7SH01_PHARH|nr:Peroxisome assembly factor 2 containing the AAA-type ATPase domain [Phaffia rhodozyma]
MGCTHTESVTALNKPDVISYSPWLHAGHPDNQHHHVAFAHSSPDKLLRAIPHVVRTTDILTIPSSQTGSHSDLKAFRVLMTEPTLSGQFIQSLPEDEQAEGLEHDGNDEQEQEQGQDGEEDEETQVLVAPWAQQPNETDNEALMPPLSHERSFTSSSADSSPSSVSSDKTVVPNGHTSPSLSSSQHSEPEWSDSKDVEDENSEDDDDFDEPDFEISPAFLQQALLGSSNSSSFSSPLSSSMVSSSPAPMTPDTTLSSSLISLPGNSSGSNPNAFDTVSMERPNAILDKSKEESGLEDSVIWTRTINLGRIGAFDGDWVAVCAIPELNFSQPEDTFGDWRIVRIRTLEETGSARSSSPRSTLIHVPPLILHNLAPLATSPPQLKIHPTSFSPALPVPIPTAASLVLSRLASPASTSKRLQPQVVFQLREFFGGPGTGNRRVLKVGDIVGVGVDEFLSADEESGESRNDAGEKNGDRSLLGSSQGSSIPTTMVFFQVSKIEGPGLASSVSSSGETAQKKLSTLTTTRETRWERRASRGEFGYVVDPEVTVLVQAGLVHRQAVGGSMGDWLGIPNLLPAPSPGISPPSPLLTLYEILRSSLGSSMGQCGLQLSILLKGARGSGKRTITRSAAARLGFGMLEINCFELVADTDSKTEGVLRARFERAAGSSPCILLLRHIEALARKGQAQETGKEPQIAGVLQDCIQSLSASWKTTGFPVVVVGTTSDGDKVPSGVLGCFKQEISIQAPDEKERLSILRRIIAETPIAADVDVKNLAVQTAALVAQDLVALVARAKSAAVGRTSESSLRTSCPLIAFAQSGLALTSSDFSQAIDQARAAYSESIGAPKIPNVGWDDVGGLISVKKEILDTIELPLKHPELFAEGLKKRSGILLYGPPGTGKTLLAKAVATSCSLNFFSVKGPELLNMYIGESEANVRRVFQRARDAKPCCIFFDELDSVAPKRGNQGDSGGVMDRIVSQLLAELDGAAEGSGSSDVFVIGATNRPDLLDPALLRPGRFDRMLYLGVSDTHEAQLNIIKALTRKFKMDPGLDLDRVAERCPFNYTGADFYALCSDAMLKAMSRKAEEVDKKIAEMNAAPRPESSPHPYPLSPQYYLSELARPEEIAVLVSQEDFDLALRELIPSVSETEMEHYRRVQKQFQSPGDNQVDDESRKDAKGKGRA